MVGWRRLCWNEYASPAERRLGVGRGFSITGGVFDERSSRWDIHVHDSRGHLVIAIDIDKFVGRASFDATVQVLVDRAHNSAKAPDTDALYIPGEIERNVSRDRTVTGVPLSKAVLADFQAAAEELGVPTPTSITLPRDAFRELGRRCSR